MTTTSVDDAIILPQSQGTGLSEEESVIDAAINGVLNRYVGGEYVSSTYSTGLAFQNHDGTNDTVEVGPGIVFVQDNSTSTSGERGSGGNPQAESSTTSGYDTELPEGHTYAVLLSTTTQISVSDSTLNEVYVDLPDVTANNAVNLEHDGSTTASPGSTSLKIGETNPDDASADTRANDDPTFSSLTVNGTTDTDSLNASTVKSGSLPRVVDNFVKSASGGNPIDITIPQADSIKIQFYRVELAGDLTAQFSNDGGSTFVSTSDYQWVRDQIGSTGTDDSASSSSDSKIIIGQNYKSGFGRAFLPLKLDIANPTDGFTHMSWTGTLNNDDEVSNLDGSGMLEKQDSTDTIRFQSGSGDMTLSGQKIIYPGDF